MFNFYRFKGTEDLERRVTKFLWFPKGINGKWKWLTRATWIEHRVVSLYFGIGRYTARFWAKNPPKRPNYFQRRRLKKKMWILWEEYISISNDTASFGHLRSDELNALNTQRATNLRLEAENIKKKLDQK